MAKKRTEENQGNIEQLKFDDKNFNKHTEYGMGLLEKSLRENGAGRSVLVDKDDNIIAGNGIVEAAQKAGIVKTRIVEVTGDELVVVKRTDLELDSKKGREMAFADNATAAADLSWDEERIGEAADEWGLVPEDWGVELPEAADGNGGGASEDEFDESEVTEAVCKRGEVWKLGEHRLMCGDSTSEEDFAKLMGEERADMVFTDPPYGVSYSEKNEFLNALGKPMACPKRIENDDHSPEEMYDFWVKAFTKLHEFSKEQMAYYITAPQGGDLLLLQAIRDSGFMLKHQLHQLVWNKNNHVLGRCDYNYKHEPMIYGWKIGGTHNFYGGGDFKTSVWDIAKPLQSKLHPTMKPVELVANCLKDCTKEGDIVLDAFGGSGTTIIAAEQLGRKCRMMELDPHYCDVIIARWEKLTGQKAERIDYGIR